MFWWLYELLSSLKFLTITGNRPFFQSKRVYEFVIPAVVASIFGALLIFRPNIVNDNILKEFSANLFQLMVFVIPFHMAALAALSTYTSSGLDEKLPGVDAQLKVWSNSDNGYFYKEITIRQYASMLFGYLCSIGIIYVLTYLFAYSLKWKELFGDWLNAAHNLAMLAAVFFVLHYVTLTVYAITFLFDKANRIRSV